MGDLEATWLLSALMQASVCSIFKETARIAAALGAGPGTGRGSYLPGGAC